MVYCTVHWRHKGGLLYSTMETQGWFTVQYNGDTRVVYCTVQCRHKGGLLYSTMETQGWFTVQYNGDAMASNECFPLKLN